MTRNLALERSIELPEVIPACYLGMFLLGFTTNIYGPSLVYIAAETRASTAEVGLLVLLHSLGFVLATLTANRLARRLEMRRSLAAAAALIAAGTLGLIGLPAPVNLFTPLIIGFGCGTIEILLNRLVEVLAVQAPAAELNRVHSMWGVGALTMPLVVAGVVWLGMNWRAAGLFLIAVALLTSWMVLRWREFTMWHGDTVQWRGLAWRSITLFVLMVVVYVGAEQAVGAWATTFFAKLGEGPFIGAIATSLFFITFSVGRIALAPLPEKLGYARTVRLAMLIGAGSFVLVLVPSLALAGFALTGLSFSIVFPTMFAWAARRHPEIRPQIATAVIASTGLGGMLIPYGIGWGVQLFGAPALPPLLLVTSLAVSAIALFEPDR